MSSLYDIINTPHSVKSIKDGDKLQQGDREHCCDRERVFEESGIKINFCCPDIHPTLYQILKRNHQRMIKSEQYGFELTLSSKLKYCTESDQSFPNESCCKSHMTKVVIRRQKLLNGESYQLSEELKIIDEQLGELEQELAQKSSAVELKQFRRTIDKLSSITNLVFGLELRLSEKFASNPDHILTSMLRRRLSEASDIKDKHEESLDTVGKIVRDRLGISRHLSFRSIIRNKQRVIALSRILKMEMHYVEMQMKLIIVLL